MKKSTLLFTLFAGFSCFFYSGSVKDEVRSSEARRLESLSFDPAMPVHKRINTAASVILSYAQQYDSRPDYTIYRPTPEEQKLIETYVTLLPQKIQQELQKSMTGFYFINNFLGNGFTEWVLDENDNIYTFIIFDRQVLKKDISQLLTEKEATGFIADKDYRLTIDAGRQYKGLLYMMIHESVHAVDYVHNITPYTDDGQRKWLKKDEKSSTVFTEDVWLSMKSLRSQQLFEPRDDVTFYGFNDGPKVSVSSTPEIYRSLEDSPFLSLYSVLNWSEDLAEFATFTYLEKRFNITYQVQIHHNEERIYSSSFNKNNKKFIKRLEALKTLGI